MTRRRTRTISKAWFAVSAATAVGAATWLGAQPPPAASIQVPPGFEVIRVAAPPLVSYPILGGFDDRGRLFIAESTGVNLDQKALEEQTPHRMRVLEDIDGDGIFDRSNVFAEKLTYPQGAQWHDGALYVASPPSIWRFEDTDDDGRADSRREIATGFKYTGNAADVHGPFLHPNGRLYWCHGRKGHEVYQQNGALVSKGLDARIWSCRPDGTDIQVHAGGGMDNPTLLTFNQEGEIFGTVNIFQSPRSDAVLHWIHGAFFARTDRREEPSEFKRTGALLQPVTLLGHVAPAGIALLKNENWGPEFRDNLFLAEFDTRRIMRVPLEREGATFRGQREIFASTDDPGVHFTGVIEDADGSLLIIDTGAWFIKGCPTSSVVRPDTLGAIYRIRRTGAKAPVDPRGLAIAWRQIPVSKLVEFLADSRPAVRDRAVSELARKGGAAVDSLRTALESEKYLARSNAVWALARIGSTEAQAASRQGLADLDFRIRQASCQSAFITTDQSAFDPLVRLLGDEAASVKREAARALGRLRNPAAILPLAGAVTWAVPTGTPGRR